LKIFTFDYQINNITRLEIAADTTGLCGSHLYVIQDLCTANSYFSNLEKVNSQSINTFSGRVLEDCKYQTYGTLRISVNEDGVVHIGSPKNWKYIKSYNKSQFSEDFQKQRFVEKFGTDEGIYRLEVSLNNEGCRREKVNLYQLDDPDYLTYLFKKSAHDYLTFKDLKSKPIYRNGNKELRKIRLVEEMKFEYPGNTKDNQDNDVEENPNPNKSESNVIKNNRSELSKEIRKYFQSQENIEEIIFIVKNNWLNYSKNATKHDDIAEAVFRVNKMAEKISCSPQTKIDLINAIKAIWPIETQIIVSKDLVTKKQIVKDSKRYGLMIAKTEKLF
jgi:hypothetical protein